MVSGDRQKVKSKCFRWDEEPLYRSPKCFRWDEEPLYRSPKCFRWDKEPLYRSPKCFRWDEEPLYRSPKGSFRALWRPAFGHAVRLHPLGANNQWGMKKNPLI